VQLSNCSFWGPHRQIIHAEGTGLISLSQCNFCQWAGGVPAVEVLGGNLILQASRFGQRKPHVRLAPDVKTAVLMGNSFRGGPQVANESTGQVEMLGNVTRP
jgi:hypothetical protein